MKLISNPLAARQGGFFSIDTISKVNYPSLLLTERHLYDKMYIRIKRQLIFLGTIMKKNNILKLICSLLSVLALASCAASPGFEFPSLDVGMPAAEGKSIIDPASEVRGVWIASVFNINYPSRTDLDAASLKSEIDAILDSCEKNNLNTVFFQVRPSCDALYESELFPVSRSLSTTGKLSFDPLRYLLEEGHKRNIFIHAWINPLRITTTADSEGSLPASSPAVKHPEWTVKYADGKLYFNAGVPELRAFVAEGVREIVENYDVDGIVFDDYFYPYPVSGADFDDSEEYALYGKEYATLADFRRDNINKLIKEVYDTVKDADSECKFGVSPAGVWQNNDGVNGGSDTRGFEAYHEIYCDAVAWIKGGYIDYISPQIYWQIGKSGTPFDTVADWWNACLDGTGVELWISHGAYRYDAGDWGDASGEMASQLEYSRKLISYRGSVFYGYDKLRDSAYGMTDELLEAYKYEIIYCDPSASASGVAFKSPYIGAECPVGSLIIEGVSDPSRDLKLEGVSVGRLRDGSFSVSVNVTEGENRFTFTQGDSRYILTVYGTEE